MPLNTEDLILTGLDADEPLIESPSVSVCSAEARDEGGGMVAVRRDRRTED